MLSGCVVGWIKSNGLMCVGKVEREKKAVVLIWLIFRDACRIWLTLHRPIAVSKKH